MTPYEFQPRVERLKAPQVLLKKFFAKNKIPSLGLHEDLTLLDSKDYFLYGDATHLSYLGRKTMANKMVEKLK